MRTIHRYGACSLAVALAFGCSDRSASGPDSSSDASVVDANVLEAAPDAPLEARPPDPYNGDCKSARWANVSDACWSCFCSKCEKPLDQCGDACFEGIKCANDNHVLVGVASDLSCELRAYTAVCESDPVVLAALSVVTSFDSCLIGSHNPSTEKLRACEAACGTIYTGDVCQRFPVPSDGGADVGVPNDGSIDGNIADSSASDTGDAGPAPCDGSSVCDGQTL